MQGESCAAAASVTPIFLPSRESFRLLSFFSPSATAAPTTLAIVAAAGNLRGVMCEGISLFDLRLIFSDSKHNVSLYGFTTLINKILVIRYWDR